MWSSVLNVRLDMIILNRCRVYWSLDKLTEELNASNMDFGIYSHHSLLS